MLPRRTPPPEPATLARDIPPPEPGASAVAQPGSLWVTITGQTAGTNLYSWTQLNEGDAPTFAANLADAFAATGGTTADAAPAYEVNGRTDVPIGVKVRLWPAGDLTYYLFDAASISPWKAPVRVATTAAGTLASSFENGDTVDGVTLATGDRILIKDQSSASENGIYTVNASGAPTRATDADSASELESATVAVNAGTVNAHTVWLCTATVPITVNTTPLPWKNIPTNSGGTDNHITRYDAAYGLQNSRPVIADSGDTSFYNTDTPSSGSSFALVGHDRLAAPGPGSTNQLPELVLAPLGGTSGATWFSIRTATDAATGTKLGTVYAKADFDGTAATQLAVSLTDLSATHDLSATTPLWRITAVGGVPTGYLWADGYLSSDGAIGSSVMKVGASANLTGAFRNYLFAPMLAADAAKRIGLSVMDAGVEKDGIYGTLAPGMTVSGGLITSAGSGSFVTTGANTFTDTQTIASPNAPALVVQQTSNNASHTLEVKNIAGTVTFFVTGNGDVTAHLFSGDGSGLTNLNASNLATGTVPLARLPAGVANAGAGSSLALFSTCY